MLLSANLVASAVPLITFDGAASTTFKFKELNDPVMGGKSTGTWTVNAADKFGVFDGDVADVPSLKAPGFIKAQSQGGGLADASSEFGGDLVLMVRTTTPEYAGFHVALASGAVSADYSCAGGGSLPFSRGCFKAKFTAPAGSDFAEVRIPFNTFSDKWSPATGEPSSTCAKDTDVCLTAKALSKISRFEVWGEGTKGKLHLEIQSVSADLKTVSAERLYQMTPSPARPPAAFDTCSGPVQKALRYGISGRNESTIPVPVNPDENLATAVCCDNRTKVFAEPRFLFSAPDIDLFGKLTGKTTFYDSVCGIPLFTAPQNRTMEEFKADTTEHGWPSFRPSEIIAKNVLTDKTSGFVYSTCGTHLGSFLPDDKGARWCLDLSCLAGSPPAAPVL